MTTLGITGFMGAGKSYACKLFAEQGIPVYNSDNEVKKLLNTNPYLKLEMWQKFGKSCYKNDKWDRDYVVKITKKNPEIINEMGKIIEPYLVKDFKDFKFMHAGNTTGYSSKMILIESAILTKSKSLMDEIDKIVVVNSSQKTRMARIKERDPFRTDDEIKILLNNQKDMPLLCDTDFFIYNDLHDNVPNRVLEIIKIVEN